MRLLVAISAAAMVGLGGAGVASAEPPVFELNGLPITQHQLVAANTGLIRERTLTPALTTKGMPASPHQMAVLSPRPILTADEIARKLEQEGLTRVRFVGPQQYTVMGVQDGGWVRLSVDSRTGQLAVPVSSD